MFAPACVRLAKLLQAWRLVTDTRQLRVLHDNIAIDGAGIEVLVERTGTVVGPQAGRGEQSRLL